MCDRESKYKIIMGHWRHMNSPMFHSKGVGLSCDETLNNKIEIKYWWIKELTSGRKQKKNDAMGGTEIVAYSFIPSSWEGNIYNWVYVCAFDPTIVHILPVTH